MHQDKVTVPTGEQLVVKVKDPSYYAHAPAAAAGKDDCVAVTPVQEDDVQQVEFLLR